MASRSTKILLENCLISYVGLPIAPEMEPYKVVARALAGSSPVLLPHQLDQMVEEYWPYFDAWCKRYGKLQADLRLEICVDKLGLYSMSDPLGLCKFFVDRVSNLSEEQVYKQSWLYKSRLRLAELHNELKRMLTC